VRSRADPTFSYVERRPDCPPSRSWRPARARSSRASLLRRRPPPAGRGEHWQAALVVEAAAADPDERLTCPSRPRPSPSTQAGGDADRGGAGARARDQRPGADAPVVVAAAPAAGSPPTALLTPGDPSPRRSGAGTAEPLLRERAACSDSTARSWCDAARLRCRAGAVAVRLRWSQSSPWRPGPREAAPTLQPTRGPVRSAPVAVVSPTRRRSRLVNAPPTLAATASPSPARVGHRVRDRCATATSTCGRLADAGRKRHRRVAQNEISPAVSPDGTQ